MKYIDPNGESFLSALGFLFGSSNPFGWIAFGIIGTALVAKMVYDYYHRDRLELKWGDWDPDTDDTIKWYRDDWTGTIDKFLYRRKRRKNNQGEIEMWEYYYNKRKGKWYRHEKDPKFSQHKSGEEEVPYDELPDAAKKGLEKEKGGSGKSPGKKDLIPI